MIEGVLDVECIFATLKEAKTTKKDVGVKHFRDDPVDKSHAQCLVLISLGFILPAQKCSEVHLVKHFNLDSDRQNDNWHDKVYEQLLQILVDSKLLLNQADTLEHADEELLHVVLIKWYIIETAHYTPVHEVSTETNQFGNSFTLNYLKGMFYLTLAKYCF